MVSVPVRKAAPAKLSLDTGLIPVGSRVAVAVSAGADSTALLLALHEQAATLGIGLCAAHLHHGIRGEEADGDRKFLRDLCGRLGLPLHEDQQDVPQSAASDGETLEEAARNARLRFFAGLLARGVVDVVVTAHTSDDQAETVMMKLLRGAWTEGLGGIAPTLWIDAKGCPVLQSAAVGRVARPLLASTRTDVLAFLDSRGQTWREDSSNASDAHTRNRVRRDLMPLLREFNPKLSATLGNLAGIARDEEAHWQSEIARLYQQLAVPGRPVRGGGRAVSTAPETETVAFEIERLRALDAATRRRLVRFAAFRLGASLNAQETLRVLLLAGVAPQGTPADSTVPGKPNSRIDLREGVRAERSVRELRLSRTA